MPGEKLLKVDLANIFSVVMQFHADLSVQTAMLDGRNEPQLQKPNVARPHSSETSNQEAGAASRKERRLRTHKWPKSPDLRAKYGATILPQYGVSRTRSSLYTNVIPVLAVPEPIALAAF